MYSDTGNTTSLVLGFPIRKSSDQRSVDSSPRHIAASHVLHRLSMPRHPPCALKHLRTQKPLLKLHIFDEHAPRGQRIRLDARNHYSILKYHTPPPRWRDTTRNSRPTVVSGPNSVSGDCLLLCTQPPSTTDENPSRLTPHQLECFSWCSLERR